MANSSDSRLFLESSHMQTDKIINWLSKAQRIYFVVKNLLSVSYVMEKSKQCLGCLVVEKTYVAGYS